jgi:CheY-like chemotaxis protein
MAAETLLLVEDNDITREGLAVVLRRAGYNVVAAADGKAALEQLLNKPPPAASPVQAMGKFSSATPSRTTW